MKKELREIPIYLFSKENPKGEIFKFLGGEESEEYKKKIKDGWFDSPAHLDLPKDMDTGLTTEDVEAARPEHLIAILKNYGFIVLTPEQLKAEAVKMAEISLDVGNFSDSDILSEFIERGLVVPEVEPEIEEAEVVEEAKETEQTEEPKEVEESSVLGENLKDQFLRDSSSLSREGLNDLAKEVGALIRVTWSDDVVIGKISEKLKEG